MQVGDLIKNKRTGSIGTIIEVDEMTPKEYTWEYLVIYDDIEDPKWEFHNRVAHYTRRIEVGDLLEHERTGCIGIVIRIYTRYDNGAEIDVRFVDRVERMMSSGRFNQTISGEIK